MRKWKLFFLLFFVTLFVNYMNVQAETLTLPKDLKKIEKEAFLGDTSLDEVIIPEGAEKILSKAFAYSSVNRIVIPETVTEIAEDAFENVTGGKIILSGVNPSAAYSFAQEHADEGVVWVESFRTVTFGYYEQDNDLENGKEPIKWLILAREGNYALLLSEYALDKQPYDKDYDENDYDDQVNGRTWETCTLRRWLNDTFINIAFSSEEQGAIRTTLVDNSQSQGYEGLRDWAKLGITNVTFGGNNTNDQVFLLSCAETQKYFPGWYKSNHGTYMYKSDMMPAKPTAYLSAQGVGHYYTSDTSSEFYKYNGYCFWWLRSPGWFQRDASFVNSYGELNFDYVINNKWVAVRPALWVDLDTISK